MRGDLKVADIFYCYNETMSGFLQINAIMVLIDLKSVIVIDHKHTKSALYFIFVSIK